MLLNLPKTTTKKNTKKPPWQYHASDKDKYKDKDEYKDSDRDKDAKRITESLAVCYIFGILMNQAFQV